jgi:epoxyqueuosine reductase QueG
VVPRALARALVAQDGAFAVRFPFASAPLLPMQRLGRAAGLPAPGPLGLQIHPRFGPWWAYRAFAVLTVALPEEPTVDSPCEGCPAPCTSVCPGQAVATGGFVLGRCIARRLADEGCHLSCAARLRCPVGAAEAYPPEQLGYHMAASLRHLRAPPG